MTNHIIRNAEYQDTGVHAYKDNPFIEALPPIQEPFEDTKNLISKVMPTLDDLKQKRVIRAHNIHQITGSFFQPLAMHMLLSERISLMIRGGYVGRNPNTGKLQQHLQNGYERLQTGDLNAKRFDETESTAHSMAIIGCSGSGKTTSLRRILGAYPQVIFHPTLNCHQIVYLKIDCSHDGSLKELCLNFFRAIDKIIGSNYEKKYGMKRHGVETMLALMAQTANMFALGLLVIDEIQHLSRAKSGGSEKMLNFFVTMTNTIGIPVLFVGTPKARDIFDLDLRSSRRAAGLGSIFWNPIPQYLPDQKSQNPEWIAFTNTLWKLQYLQKRDPILNDEIRDTWFDLSQGILDIVVKLFILAQLRALATGAETITVELLKRVYEDELKLVHPMLSALRSGIPERIAQFSDLAVPDMDKKIIHLIQKISASTVESEEDQALKQLSNDDQRRVYLMLKDEFPSDSIIFAIQKIVALKPQISRQQLLAAIVQAMETDNTPSQAPATKKKKQRISLKQWNELADTDLRHIFSMNPTSSESIYTQLDRQGLILQMSDVAP